MLTHPNFDPVAIHIGPLAVRWYGLMYLVGFAISYWLGRLRIARGRSGRVTLQTLDDLLFFCVLGVIVGGRLGYVQSWNFNVQRELRFHMVLDAGYIATKGTALRADGLGVLNQLPPSALALGS